MRVLAEAGVPVGVLVAPIIPVLTEHEIEAVLEAAREAGASLAGYTLLRLPWEVKDLFREWLAEHFPDRAAHVMSIVRAMRGERDNDPELRDPHARHRARGAADSPAFPARLPPARVSRTRAQIRAAHASFSAAATYSSSAVARSALIVRFGNPGIGRRGHKVMMLRRGILAAPIDIPHHALGAGP